MDYTAAQLRTLVKRTFALASEYRIAVALHIDDSKFWLDRRNLWRNPANGMARLEWNSEQGRFAKLALTFEACPTALS